MSASGDRGLRGLGSGHVRRRALSGLSYGRREPLEGRRGVPGVGPELFFPLTGRQRL
jgi:hypothetical protein